MSEGCKEQIKNLPGKGLKEAAPAAGRGGGVDRGSGL